MPVDSATFVPPHRNGVSASCVGTPPGTWPSTLSFLVERFPTIDAQEWQARFARQDVFDAQGNALPIDAPYTACSKVYYFRSIAQERPIPFQAQVLFQDEHIVVADKPHFLPVVPSGQYLQETLLVRLKRELGLPTLAPAHRIDRDTAGLVLFTVQPQERGAYQALFRKRMVDKMYEAIAPTAQALTFPLERQTRLSDDTHFMQMTEVPGEPNAITQIELSEQRGAWALYRLHPLTGQRHQLRVHMNALGLPLLNDQMYPTLQPAVPDTDTAWQERYQYPLGLLAKSIRFTDPITGQLRLFSSNRQLQWPT